MNPYQTMVATYDRLAREGKKFPLGGFPPCPRPKIGADAPVALFFAPHPDDETISGGLALRLFREAGMRMIDVAITQGSNRARQTPRLRELKAACDHLGFGLLTTRENGLERINPKTRSQDPDYWSGCVSIIADILAQQLPRVIMFPHDRDWNSTHIGTYWLVVDALKQLPPDFECYTVETEFWGAMTDPNLMLEISPADLTDLITATTFHVGEVERNPYHLLLPAWMQDNVRRGTELVGGQGGCAPDCTFAALYRLRQWKNGDFAPALSGGKYFPASANVRDLFP